MSETRPPYNGQSLIVTCSICSCIIGAFVRRGQLTLLRIGAVEVYTASGYCAACGAPWHWHASPRAIQDILGRREDGKP